MKNEVVIRLLQISGLGLTIAPVFAGTLPRLVLGFDVRVRSDAHRLELV